MDANNPNPPNWDTSGIKRAIELMKAAGWVERADLDSIFTGLKLTPEGNQKAFTFFEIFKELGCRSPEDLSNVLGLISWYLNTDEMN
jgi:hypothetical protein